MNATIKENYVRHREDKLNRNLERQFWDAVQYMEEFSLLMEEVEKEI